ncbi:DUF2225 domain-containing protein [Mesoterricola silvestris]|uniref:DUF2225 domain-containing protein n=1 Tax=Mesoterricola silvestris TaxID=2927979 RepID=A0AA48K7M8_9BACT|nr:DUF2225 domain-containing protein [Mesoterricola silvestris]BDU72049.1 hypothetical protein METEAL_12230 [Mesoterricola silvestris]
MAEEPLLTKTIQCPACEQKVPLRMANPRLYTVASRESDRHVTSYRWLRSLVTDVVPHHYRVWQCPRCLFADFADKVDKEKLDGSHDEARSLFMDISIEKRVVLDSLRKLVPQGDLDARGAVAIHLAALLIAFLPGKRMDHAKLGRLAIRLGWLYREMDGPATPPPEPESRTMPELAEATERLDRLLKDAAAALEAIQSKGRLRGAELRLPADGNPYLAHGELIEVRLRTVQADVATLQLAVLADQQGRLTPPPPPGADAGGTLAGSLNAILPLWPDLPRNERQCMLLALEALEYSYQFERGSGSEDEGLAQVNIILDLLIRLGLLERALDWTSQISKFATDSVEDLQNRIAKGRGSGTMTPFDETVINRKIAAMGLTRQKAGERRREVLELILDRDREAIDASLTATAQRPSPERVKALLDLGIHQGVVALLGKELADKTKDSPGWFKNLLKT